MNFKKGFTLIELLVVVAIIGLLATVVLASLTSAKNKGDDAAVKTNLATARSVMEIFFVDNSNSYLPVGGTVFGIATCPTYDLSGNGTNIFSKNKNLADAIAEAVKRGNGSSCYNSTNTWAVAIGLKLISNTSWCIDNQGTARVVNSVPSGAINSSTFLCN